MNRPLYYTLFEGETHPCSLDEAEAMLRDIELRRVAYDIVGPFEVSTVFLVIDYDHTGEGPPLLFETMVFEEEYKILVNKRHAPTHRQQHRQQHRHQNRLRQQMMTMKSLDSVMTMKKSLDSVMMNLKVLVKH